MPTVQFVNRSSRTGRLLVAVAAVLLLLGAWSPTSADASVPGLDFTETGCEEHSDSVARLYTAGLGRAPEEGGFDFWMTEYTTGRQTFESMAAFFVTSPEFQGSYGELTDLELVNQLYRNILGREGEEGGVTFWTGELSGGMSRPTLLMRLTESPENIGASGTASPLLGEFNEGQSEPWNCVSTKWIGVPNTFPTGTHLVGADVPAGRYTFAADRGCYWVRLSGTEGTADEIISNDYVGTSSRQIVDISPTDKAISFNSKCGQLTQFIAQPTISTVLTGMYVVGQEVVPGTYITQADAGCYWESASDASGSINSIIANEYAHSASQLIVTLHDGEVFTSEGGCGTWSLQ